MELHVRTHGMGLAGLGLESSRDATGFALHVDAGWTLASSEQ